MASILKVENISHTNGSAAMTIDSSGRILQPAKPAWRIQRTEGQTLTTNNVEHPIAFDNTDSARNNFLQGGCTLGSSPDYLVTVPVAGVYMVSLVIRVDGIGSGYVIARIEKNKNTANTTETTIISGNNTSSNYENLTATTVFQANAGDTFGATIMASADTNFSVVGGTELSGFLIG